MTLTLEAIQEILPSAVRLQSDMECLAGEIVRFYHRPTKKVASRIRKLLNEMNQNVKLAKTEFKERAMEKFGVEEDPHQVRTARQTARCPKCGLFLTPTTLESNVVLCKRCGSEPFEEKEPMNAPIDPGAQGQVE